MSDHPGKYLYFQITDSDEFVRMRYTDLCGQPPKEIYITDGRFKYKAAGPVEESILKPIPTTKGKG